MSNTDIQTIAGKINRKSQKRKSSKGFEFTRPIAIERILKMDIPPSKEEYNRLKDLDQTQNVSKFATSIANCYVEGAESLNRYKRIVNRLFIWTEYYIINQLTTKIKKYYENIKNE